MGNGGGEGVKSVWKLEVKEKKESEEGRRGERERQRSTGWERDGVLVATAKDTPCQF